MKFSDETIGILKNFSQINPSILFKEGNTLRTISPTKTVMASAVVQETFDHSAGVYDVARFLATLSLFDSPDVEFGDKQFNINGGKSVLKCTYTSENMIVSPPDKDIQVPSPDAEFTLDWKDLEKVIKAAGVLQLPEISFVSDGESVSLAAVDSKNPTADTYSHVVVEDKTFAEFRMSIKVENLKLLPSNYDVALSSKGMAHFKGEKVQYWVAVETPKK